MTLDSQPKFFTHFVLLCSFLGQAGLQANFDLLKLLKRLIQLVNGLLQLGLLFMSCHFVEDLLLEFTFLGQCGI